MKSLIKYPEIETDLIRRLIEGFHDQELHYSCADLYDAGLCDSSQLAEAIRYANQTLFRAGLNPQHYIKPIFVTNIENGETYRDWKMSQAGFLLVFLSAQESNRLFNRYKIELINRLLK
ncbi:hypothetical protein [uncultured Sunxiuqinia sp.]|uniref:hypothetical protein n=1 Tax=uncultured Sunxiuqinia sp. TaxID=1573825 RepID=UPI0030D9BC5D|tara:strand:- start:2049 stop:2405 length:357 start_codon:yes stop_codon:yes gene_type:complete